MEKRKKAIHSPHFKETHFPRSPTEIEKALSDLANEWIAQMQASGKLRDRPSWNEAFMHSAYEAADRSSCRYLWTGAVIVKHKRIIASGYNGAPTNSENCRDRGCRKEEKNIPDNIRGTGNCRGAHAERNAMDQIARVDLIGTTIYTVFYPCSDCAKTIVGNEIDSVYYSIMYGEPDSLTRELFTEAGVKLKELKPNLEKRYLRLKQIDNQRFNKNLVQLL